MQEQFALRTDAGGEDEEQSGSSLSSMPEPSVGEKCSAAKGQMEEDDLVDSRDLSMKHGYEEKRSSDPSIPRRG